MSSTSSPKHIGHRRIAKVWRQEEEEEEEKLSMIYCSPNLYLPRKSIRKEGGATSNYCAHLLYTVSKGKNLVSISQKNSERKHLPLMKIGNLDRRMVGWLCSDPPLFLPKADLLPFVFVAFVVAEEGGRKRKRASILRDG